MQSALLSPKIRIGAVRILIDFNGTVAKLADAGDSYGSPY